MISAVVREVRGKTGNLLAQVIRYGIGGLAAFAVDVAVLVALTELAGLHYLASAVIGFACGVVTHYAASVVWVFDKRAVSRRPVEFTGFVTLGLIGMCVNASTLFVLTEFVALHYAIAKVFAAVPSFTWNFASRKVLLFSARERAGKHAAHPLTNPDSLTKAA